KNLFNDFPQEVSFTIFDFLDVTSLGLLALVDLASRNVILNYVKSKKFVDRVKSDLVISSNEPPLDVDQLCRTLANVFKRSTMIMPTLDRVAIVHSFLFQMAEYSKLDETEAKRWGTFWHRVMRGWEFMECSKAYGHLLNSNNINGKKLLTTFCNAGPGRNSQQEFGLHVFFRWFIFEHPYNKNEDIGYWLSAVLSDFAMYHQAKLLYLIFGPVNLDKRTIEWNVMCTTPANVDLAERFFKKLARCFRLLQSYMPGFWTDDTIVSLVEELTSFPDGWLLDNFAYFLLYCDDKIVTGILSSRVINGRLDEVCYIFHSMCLCVSRTSRNMALMVRYFQKLMCAITSESLKLRFIKAFAHQSAVRLPVLYSSSGTPNVGVVAEVNAHEQFYGLIFLIVARHFAAHQQNQLAEQ
uniref:F-box domain-containing protein n=1 Tax=Romanomermis culicivorax TaxID=13658 RepID=A0A915J587_ROMCU